MNVSFLINAHAVAASFTAVKGEGDTWRVEQQQERSAQLHPARQATDPIQGTSFLPGLTANP
jgi:hypothetical protein